MVGTEQDGLGFRQCPPDPADAGVPGEMTWRKGPGQPELLKAGAEEAEN
jgi:hypothetical protein